MGLSVQFMKNRIKLVFLCVGYEGTNLENLDYSQCASDIMLKNDEHFIGLCLSKSFPRE